MAYITPRTSNLAVQIQALRARVAEPYDANTDADEGFLTDNEIIRMIHAAELKVAQEAPPAALYTLSHKEDLSLSSGLANLPGSFYQLGGTPEIMHIIGVDGSVNNQYVPCRMMRRQQFGMAHRIPANRPTTQFPIATIQGEQLYVLPTSITSARIYYIRSPRMRTRHYRGTVTATASKSITDANCPFPSGYFINFYTETNVQSSIYFDSGNAAGTHANLATHTGTVFTWGSPTITPDVGVTFFAGEVSDLPDSTVHLVLDYAAYLAHDKNKQSDQAQIALQSYQTNMALVKERFNYDAGINPMEISS